MAKKWIERSNKMRKRERINIDIVPDEVHMTRD